MIISYIFILLPAIVNFLCGSCFLDGFVIKKQSVKVTTGLVLWRKIHQNIAASQQSADFLSEHCHIMSVKSFYHKQKKLP